MTGILPGSFFVCQASTFYPKNKSWISTVQHPPLTIRTVYLQLFSLVSRCFFFIFLVAFPFLWKTVVSSNRKKSHQPLRTAKTQRPKQKRTFQDQKMSRLLLFPTQLGHLLPWCLTTPKTQQPLVVKSVSFKRRCELIIFVFWNLGEFHKVFRRIPSTSLQPLVQVSYTFHFLTS